MFNIKIQQGIIDVHAHVIPGVDDGSRSMDESIHMLHMAAEQGIKAVIATPHYSRHRVLAKLKEQTEKIQVEICKTHPEFQIYPGQETFYHNELTQRLKAGEAYTMAESNYVLVEFMPQVPYETLFQGIRRLVLGGYYPILAHMERYGCLRRSGVSELLSIGCKLQMNYDSLQGHWFSPEVRWCRKQVESGVIHLLGTDMHRSDHRPPEIREALKWLDGHVEEEYIQRLVYKNPMHIIQNEHMQ